MPVFYREGYRRFYLRLVPVGVDVKRSLRGIHREERAAAAVALEPVQPETGVVEKRQAHACYTFFESDTAVQTEIEGRIVLAVERQAAFIEDPRTVILDVGKVGQGRFAVCEEIVLEQGQLLNGALFRFIGPEIVVVRTCEIS